MKQIWGKNILKVPRNFHVEPIDCKISVFVYSRVCFFQECELFKVSALWGECHL